MNRLSNVIDGKATGAERYSPIINPATEELIGEAPVSGKADVDEAYAAAGAAFAGWRRSTPGERQEALLALAGLVEKHQDQLIEAEVACTGKPRASTRDLEVVRGADQLRFFAGAARVVYGTAQTEYIHGFTTAVRREPVGVIAQITPWNYPFMMAVWKIGAALAAGNTVVLKPAETTPWSTVLLAQLAQQVLPSGVFNVVCGDRETGRALVSHPRPEMVSITGSTRAGSEVMAAAAADVKRVHLELGGKAPALVFDDADLERTADGIASAGYFNAGQDCTAASRVLVHESVHDAFVEALVAAAGRITIGGPDDPDVFAGPLNSAEHRSRVTGFLDDLPQHAQVAVGGGIRRTGFFVEPTVVTGVRQDDAIVQREIFGPVLTVQKFRDEAEAIQLANDVDFALASSLWTNDVSRCHRVAAALDFGTVWVNCHQILPAEAPHGGYKRSGSGKDLSIFGVEDYTRLKAITTAVPEA